MNKTKKIYFLISVFVFSAISLVAVSQQVLAAHGRATVSWVAPTTDEGAGDLTGLSGYRVYYSSTAIDCTAWDAATSAARFADSGTLLPEDYVDVTDEETLNYMFNNTELLTPGTEYYFAVVAYDNAEDINLSKCATGTVGETPVTTVSKDVTYSGDFTMDCQVETLDYTFYHAYYNTDNAVADANNDGLVDNLDYNFIHADYNESFAPCNQPV